MGGWIKYRNLGKDLKWQLDTAGIAPGVAATKAMVYASSSAAPYAYWSGRATEVDQLYSGLATAEAAMTTGRNDVILLTPEQHNLSAALTWDLNLTHLVGMYGGAARMGQRARIGMSTAFTPMITVSGYGNSFSNILTQHGTAAGDYIGWSISGARNTFNNVQFAGPMVAAQGGHASYKGVQLIGSENYFRDCTFGSITITRDELTPNLSIEPATDAMTYNIFENCTFLLAAEDTEPYFIKATNTSGVIMAEFIACRFVCFSSNNAVKAAVAVTVSGAATAYLMFDPNCMFVNVSLPVVAAKTGYVHQATNFPSATDEVNQIAINSAT